jgi:hypothetical protein
MQDKIITDVQRHIGLEKVRDDFILLISKQLPIVKQLLS